MNIKEYQNYVREHSSYKYNKKLAYIALVEEVGEVGGVIKKSAIYEDMSKFIEKYGMSVEDKIVDELGDCLWQYINLLNQYNLDLQDVLDANVVKLNNRHGSNKTVAKDGGKR